MNGHDAAVAAPGHCPRGHQVAIRYCRVVGEQRWRRLQQELQGHDDAACDAAAAAAAGTGRTCMTLECRCGGCVWCTRDEVGPGRRGCRRVACSRGCSAAVVSRAEPDRLAGTGAREGARQA